MIRREKRTHTHKKEANDERLFSEENPEYPIRILFREENQEQKLVKLEICFISIRFV